MNLSTSCYTTSRKQVQKKHQLADIWYLDIPPNVQFYKISIPTPWEVIRNSKEVWPSKAKISKGNETEFEFLKGWEGGSNQKNLPWRGEAWMFSGKTQYSYNLLTKC